MMCSDVPVKLKWLCLLAGCLKTNRRGAGSWTWNWQYDCEVARKGKKGKKGILCFGIGNDHVSKLTWFTSRNLF